MPGLLQTADYARAVFESGRVGRSEEQTASQLSIRLIRQDRLTEDKHPLDLAAVIDEYALRRPVGGPSVMLAQLGHLTLVAELPTVTLQVLPTSVVSNESVYGNFIVLDFQDYGQPSIVYVNHALGEERKSNPEMVEMTRLRFRHLRSVALDPDRSVPFIEQVADELWFG